MEPIFHIIIPALLLMVIFPKWEKKRIILIAILMEFLMDLDNFIPEWHRIVTHNIFWILVLALIFWKFASLRDVFMVIFYGISHLISDIGDFGVAFLWPIIWRLFALDVNASPANSYFFSFEFNLFKFEELRSISYTDYYMTQWGFSALFLIILSYFIWKLIRKRKPA